MATEHTTQTARQRQLEQFMGTTEAPVEVAQLHTPIEGGVRLFTICVDNDTASQLNRGSVRVFGAEPVNSVQTYLPNNRNMELIRLMQGAGACLCFIDFDKDREMAMETATSLHQLLGSKVLMVAISAKANADLILDAMRAGCSEYLTKPVDQERLADALTQLRRRWAPGRAGTNGQVMAFIGARGGAGTTTVVVHLATFLAQLYGKKVLVADLHRQLSHAALYMGLSKPKYNFYDLARNVDQLDNELLRGFVAHEVHGVDVLPGPEGFFAPTDASIDAIQRTLRFLRGAYEFVLIDCPHGLGPINQAAIEESDQVYLVATANVPGLRDLSQYVDRLLTYNLPAGKLNVAINRYHSKGEVTINQISTAVNWPVGATIPNSSEELIEAMNTGKPADPGSKSEFAKHMRKWATTLAQIPETAVAKRKFAFWE